MQTKIERYFYNTCINKYLFFLGGYNQPNVARLWTYLTAVIVGQEKLLSMDIPDNDFFLEYGPDYRLPVIKGYQRDTNSKEYIDNIVTIVNGKFSINVVVI